MANLLPKWGGGVISPAQMFTTLQKEATTMAKDAARLNASIGLIPFRDVQNFAAQLARRSADFQALKGNALLQAYANEIHPDPNYDIDAAIDACSAAYDAFVTTFTNLKTSGNIKNFWDPATGQVDLTAAQSLLTAIVGTVEDI